AEDGIRDFHVTGVQTCALPIFQTIARAAKLTGQAFADLLDRFFSQLPREVPYAVELRNQEFLVPPYFAVLREHNVAHVFNSWTRSEERRVGKARKWAWMLVSQS